MATTRSSRRCNDIATQLMWAGWAVIVALPVIGAVLANAFQAIDIDSEELTFNWALFTPWAVGGAVASVLAFVGASVCRAIGISLEVDDQPA